MDFNLLCRWLRVKSDPTQRTKSDGYESARIALRALLSLLEEPYPASTTWQEFVNQARAAVLRECQFEATEPTQTTDQDDEEQDDQKSSLGLPRIAETR